MIAGKTGIASTYARGRIVVGYQSCLCRLLRIQRRVEDLRVGAQDLFELVKPLFQLASVAGAQTRFLALLILTVSAISTTPATRRLTAITFHLEGWTLVVASRLASSRALTRARGTVARQRTRAWTGHQRGRTFLCLHSSHLGIGFSSASLIFFSSGSGEFAASGGSTSGSSSAEAISREERRRGMMIVLGIRSELC